MKVPPILRLSAQYVTDSRVYHKFVTCTPGAAQKEFRGPQPALQVRVRETQKLWIYARSGIISVHCNSQIVKSGKKYKKMLTTKMIMGNKFPLGPEVGSRSGKVSHKR